MLLLNQIPFCFNCLSIVGFGYQLFPSAKLIVSYCSRSQNIDRNSEIFPHITLILLIIRKYSLKSNQIQVMSKFELWQQIRIKVWLQEGFPAAATESAKQLPHTRQVHCIYCKYASRRGSFTSRSPNTYWPTKKPFSTMFELLTPLLIKIPTKSLQIEYALH